MCYVPAIDLRIYSLIFDRLVGICRNSQYKLYLPDDRFAHFRVSDPQTYEKGLSWIEICTSLSEYLDLIEI